MSSSVKCSSKGLAFKIIMPIMWHTYTGHYTTSYIPLHNWDCSTVYQRYYFHLFSYSRRECVPIRQVFWNTVTYRRVKCCRHFEVTGCLQLHALPTLCSSLFLDCLKSENEAPQKCRRKASYPSRFQTSSRAPRQTPIFFKYGTGLKKTIYTTTMQTDNHAYFNIAT